MKQLFKTIFALKKVDISQPLFQQTLLCIRDSAESPSEFEQRLKLIRCSHHKQERKRVRFSDTVTIKTDDEISSGTINEKAAPKTHHLESKQIENILGCRIEIDTHSLYGLVQITKKELKDCKKRIQVLIFELLDQELPFHQIEIHYYRGGQFEDVVLQKIVADAFKVMVVRLETKQIVEEDRKIYKKLRKDLNKKKQKKSHPDKSTHSRTDDSHLGEIEDTEAYDRKLDEDTEKYELEKKRLITQISDRQLQKVDLTRGEVGQLCIRDIEKRFGLTSEV